VPTAPLPALLRPGLLRGVGITVTSGADEAGRPLPPSAQVVDARLRELGAGPGHDVLVHSAASPTDADGARAALDGTWDVIRAHMLPPGRTGGLIVLIAPPRGDSHHAAVRAGLENMARTLSIEWARFGIRPVAVLPGAPDAVAELVAFLASRAGAYYAGCAFTLR
jgi:NAD(P)-dependent dehydrogenase (short-subunit alcohol dehydrogenase family)